MMHCDNKRAYRHLRAATTAANGRMRDGVPYLRAYLCSQCGAYHITSQKGPLYQPPIKTGGKWPERKVAT